MRISVVGCGHVGLVTAACFAHLGHDVLGIDSDPSKVDAIARGEVPFHEPGLQELVREGVESGRLSTGLDASEAGRHGDIVFICVGTPTGPNGADLRQVENVAGQIASGLDGYTVVAEKSTVPVETALWVQRVLGRSAPAGAEFDVVSNPEFLREGRAVRDTLEPDRIVVGATSDRAVSHMREAYRPILDETECPFITTDLATAELIKHASNAFLSTKISFINAVADLCEATDADVETVAHAMGLDPRIGGSFLKAGIGFGGECFPKDLLAFRIKMEERGADAGILRAAQEVNEGRVPAFVRKIRQALGALVGRRIALWGLAFKPETDDLRQAPALEVARSLMAAGATVVAYDPVAMPKARDVISDVEFAPDSAAAVKGADCLVVCTEWKEFATFDLAQLRDAMARPIVVDGRNVFRPDEMEKAGFLYVSMGRPTVDGRWLTNGGGPDTLSTPQTAGAEA